MGTKAGEGTPPKDDPKTDPPAGGDDGKKADPPKGDDDKAADPPAKKTEKTFTKADLDAAAKKAVEDAKKRWDEEKDLPELERLKKENEDLRNATRLRDAKDEVVAALKAAGNNSPELAFRAIQGDLKFDDSGKLINAKDLIEGLRAGFPEQFGTQPPADGVDAGAGQGKKGPALTAAQLEKMTQQEIAQLPWDDVKAAMTAK